MNKYIKIFAALFLIYGTVNAVTGFTGIPSGTRTFTLNDNVGKNSIEFLSEAPMEKVKGTSDEVTGSFRFDPAHLEATNGKLVVPVKSMKTAIARRDEHMYGSAWLNAAKYPEIAFEVTSLKNVVLTQKDGRSFATATAVGQFTCHGVIKPIQANVNITFLAQNEETKKRAPGDLIMIVATFDVPIKEFNISGQPGFIGSKMAEVIKVTANIFANADNSDRKL